MREAFSKINRASNGKMSEEELNWFLNYWKIVPDDKLIKKNIFDKFDVDQDGFISYIDFVQSIGKEMYPQEGLYFR